MSVLSSYLYHKYQEFGISTVVECLFCRHPLTGKERINEAIHFFSRAQAYGNAIRLCKEYHMEDQLLNLALLGKPHDMIDAAKFYEKTNDMQDKAGRSYKMVSHD